MATKPEILKELAGLGITEAESKVEGILPLKGDETGLVLSNILKKALKVKGGANGSSNQSSAQAEPVEGEVYVWVKGRTYVSDTQRIDGGFYKMTLPLPARLAKSPTTVVEVFADAIPPRKLTEIAKSFGVTHPEDFNDKELLAKITVADYKPF